MGYNSFKLMKKLIYLMVLLVSLSSFGCDTPAQKKAKESLALEAETTNKMLAGKKADAVSTILSVDFDGKNLIYTYEIDEDYISIDQARATQKDNMEKNIRTGLENNPQFAATKENLKKIGGKVIYNYIGNSSGKILTIEIDF